MITRMAKKKIHRSRLAKQQLCTCITLFCTFLCRCTTTTWNFLISPVFLSLLSIVTVSIVPVAIRVVQASSAKKPNRYKLIASFQIFQIYKGDQKGRYWVCSNSKATPVDNLCTPVERWWSQPSPPLSALYKKHLSTLSESWKSKTTVDH